MELFINAQNLRVPFGSVNQRLSLPAVSLKRQCKNAYIQSTIYIIISYRNSELVVHGKKNQFWIYTEICWVEEISANLTMTKSLQSL